MSKKTSELRATVCKCTEDNGRRKKCTHPLLKDANTAREHGVSVAVVEDLHHSERTSRQSTDSEYISEEHLLVIILDVTSQPSQSLSSSKVRLTMGVVFSSNTTSCPGSTKIEWAVPFGMTTSPSSAV